MQNSESLHFSRSTESGFYVNNINRLVCVVKQHYRICDLETELFCILTPVIPMCSWIYTKCRFFFSPTHSIYFLYKNLISSFIRIIWFFFNGDLWSWWCVCNLYIDIFRDYFLGYTLRVERVSSIWSGFWCSPSSLLFSSLLYRYLHHPPIYF